MVVSLHVCTPVCVCVCMCECVCVDISPGKVGFYPPLIAKETKPTA